MRRMAEGKNNQEWASWLALVLTILGFATAIGPTPKEVFDYDCRDQAGRIVRKSEEHSGLEPPFVLTVYTDQGKENLGQFYSLEACHFEGKNYVENGWRR